MIVHAAVKIPIGNSMLPSDCRNEGKDTTVIVLISTNIKVKNQSELRKLMRHEPDRFAGYGWIALPDNQQPFTIKQKVTNQIDIWGKEK